MKRALLVGRFQPVHKGHLFAVRSAARAHDRVVVAVGSAQYGHTWDNPFTVGERFDMWTAVLERERLRNVHLYPLTDLHHHPGWVEHARAHLPAFDVVLTNNPLTRRLFQEAGHTVRPGALWRPEVCSGTRIRTAWAQGRDPSSLLPPPAASIARGLGASERLKALAEAALAVDADR